MNRSLSLSKALPNNTHIRISFSLLLFVILSVGVHAQKKGAAPTMDYSLNPTYGEVTLDNSFGAEPHQQTITSGGEINSSYQAGCTGYVSQGPDYRLHWNGTTTQLAIFFTPTTDTEDATILVNTPDGTWICNDDMEEGNINPLALIENPSSGQYDIWVGSYEVDKYIEGTLFIADLDKYTAASSNAKLDYSLDPQYSTFSLKEGFSPDPFSISGTSGGDVDVKALSLSSDCIGYASQAPDFRLNWTGSTASLKIRFEPNNPGDDTILVINTPSGSWLCNDDESSETLNPMLHLVGEEEGQFDIWVGSLNSGDFIEGKLVVTEH